MRLTPQQLVRFNALLDQLQWTDVGLSQRLGVDRTLMVAWRNGNTPIPNYAWAFLELAASVQRAFEPLKPDSEYHRQGRGNPKVKARMDAQALKRFRDAGIL
jgi:hypothetical protein